MMVVLCGADKTRRGNRTPTNGPGLPKPLPVPPPTFTLHVHNSNLVNTVPSLAMFKRKPSADSSSCKSLPFLPPSPSPSTHTLEITHASTLRRRDHREDDEDGGAGRRGSIPEELLSPTTTSEKEMTPERSLSNPPFHRPTASWDHKELELARIGRSRERDRTIPPDSDTASMSSRASSKRSRPPPITIPPFLPAQQKSIIQREDEPERPLPSISRRHSRQTPPSTGPPTRISPPILLPSILPLAPLSMARRNSSFPEDAEGRISVDVDGDVSRRRISIAASSRRPSQISSQSSGRSSRTGSIPSDLDTRVYASRSLVSPPTDYRRPSHPTSRSPQFPSLSYLVSPSNSSLSPPSSSTPSSKSSASSYILPSTRPLHTNTISLTHKLVAEEPVASYTTPRRWKTVPLAEANERIDSATLETIIDAGVHRMEGAMSRIVIDSDGIEGLLSERRRGKQRLEELESEYEVETRERERLLARYIAQASEGNEEAGFKVEQSLVGAVAKCDRLTREILSVHASIIELEDVLASHERSVASLSILRLNDSLVLSHEHEIDTHLTLVQVTLERDEALKRPRTLEDKLRAFADEGGEVRMAVEPFTSLTRSDTSTMMETPRTTVSFRLSDLRMEIKKFPQPPPWPAPSSTPPRPYRFPTSPSSASTASPLPPAPPPKPISSLPPSYNSRTLLRPPPTRKSSKVVGALRQTLDVFRDGLSRGGGGEATIVPDEGKGGRRWRSASEPAVFGVSTRAVESGERT